jgi:hypothetical protein
MLDLQHIPSYTNPKFQVFYAGGTTTWQTWTKPKGCSMIHIFALGAGGGGGSGGVNNSAGNRFGNSGGGAGGIMSAFIPANLIPDILYIQVGKGGPGGAPASFGATGGTAGTSGGITYVATRITTTIESDLLFACFNGTGGNGGTVGAGGGVAVYDLIEMMLYTSVTGQSGAVRINGSAAGSSITATLPTTGGAAGGSLAVATATVFTAGGDIVHPINTIKGGQIEGERGSGGVNQTPSINLPYLFFTTGGAGGASNFTGGLGGDGGPGGFGSGGGAGGANTLASGTGNRGGNGGDGLVIITCY